MTLKTLELRDDKIHRATEKLGIHGFKFVERHYSKREFMREAEKYLMNEKYRI